MVNIFTRLLITGSLISLAACGGGGGGGSSSPTPPSPGITANPSSITLAEDTSTTFEVVLNTEPTADVSVPVTSSDISEASVDLASLTFTNSAGAAPWDSPQTVTVSGVLDIMADGNQNINIVLGVPVSTDADYAALSAANVAATVSDIDAAGFTVTGANLNTTESGTTDSYTVVLNTEPDGDVVIDIASANVNEGTLSAASLTFNAGNWDVPQTVIVNPVDDFAVDGNQTYNVTMAINAGNTTDTTGYAGLALVPVSVTNADDDTAGITVSTASLSTTEGGAATTFTVVLNTMPNGTVVTGVASTNTNEGLVDQIALHFNPLNWDVPQTVTVTPVDDFTVDGNQSYFVAMVMNTGLTSDTTGYADLTSSTVTVTNADNDTVDITVSTASLTTTEGGATTSFTVVLNTEPDEVVAIDVNSGDLNEGTVSPASLVFDPFNWTTPQTVTVTPVEDLVVDGDAIYEILVSINLVDTVDTTGYTSLAAIPVSVTNVDSGIAPVSEGTSAIPVVLAYGVDVPYAGTVDTTNSYYEITGVYAGTSYAVSISGMSADADLFVYDDLMQTAPLCSSGTAGDDACNATPTGTSIWVRVSGQWTGGFGAGYTLDVAGPAAEGTMAMPAVLAYGIELPYAGSVDATNSYYELIGVTAGTTYDVSITGTSTDADLYVYDDLGYSALLCSSAQVGDDSCTATPTGTSLWVRVYGGWTGGAGAVYTLGAVEPPLVPNFTSINTPLALVDTGTFTDTLTAVGAPASLTSVEVLIDITHTWDSDLDITLISPAGTRVLLSSGNGGGGDNYTNTTFSDAATISIADGVAPFSGWFVPMEALSLLNGENGNGTWSLEIADTFTGDTGEIVSWGVKLQ